MRGEDGSIGVFATVITLALVLVAGLVLDGGRLLAARRQADDIAANAARAGAQAIDETSLRSGGTTLDPIAGRDAVAVYLAATPATGTARITGDTVTVDARLAVPMLLLTIAGIGTTTVTARRQARAVRGVTAGES
ncbi:MAG: hypothetical protein KY460_11970 [Actinobacteria bacterium]|nr:hypothetical protein [Actinomycetota bacterium]